jgi:hypothetical protein
LKRRVLPDNSDGGIAGRPGFRVCRRVAEQEAAQLALGWSEPDGGSDRCSGRQVQMKRHDDFAECLDWIQITGCLRGESRW